MPIERTRGVDATDILVNLIDAAGQTRRETIKLLESKFQLLQDWRVTGKFLTFHPAQGAQAKPVTISF
jgi:hypothetical protein